MKSITEAVKELLDIRKRLFTSNSSTFAYVMIYTLSVVYEIPVDEVTEIYNTALMEYEIEQKRLNKQKHRAENEEHNKK